MIQVVRWYLSAFHAGRKSSIAKKPYNPVLGEVFKCYWNVPGIGNKVFLILLRQIFIFCVRTIRCPTVQCRGLPNRT